MLLYLIISGLCLGARVTLGRAWGLLLGIAFRVKASLQWPIGISALPMKKQGNTSPDTSNCVA